MTHGSAFFGLRFGSCPLCGRTIFLKLGRGEWSVRCLRCWAHVVALAMASALRQTVGTLENKIVYELSARGPLYRFLSRQPCALTVSEFYDDVQPGGFRGAVQCQDVQSLTFVDESFDLCTSTEVFEHVPDDVRGFREVLRVLKPGGLFLFTVPMLDQPATEVRAVRRDDRIIHHLPPEYHHDSLRGRRAILCYRTYGHDIAQRLREAGFAEAWILRPSDPTGWGHDRQVVVGRKQG